jgi:hypothetical protein
MTPWIPLTCLFALQFPFGGAQPVKKPTAPPPPHPKPPTASALMPPRQGDPKVFRQEPGVFPTIFPQPADARLDDVALHLDTVGGCDQQLRALAAAPSGGFAAVWNDSRDGNLGLYLGLLDADGKRIGSDAPINPPLTSRQFEPSLALTGGQRGAVAWFSTSFGYNGVRLRMFDGLNGFSGPDVALGLLQPAAAAPRGGGRSDAAPAAGAAPRGGAAPGGREAPAAGAGAAGAGAAGAGASAAGGAAPAGRDGAAAGPAAGRGAGASGAAPGRAPKASSFGAQALPSDRLPGVVITSRGAGAAVWADGGAVWMQSFRSPTDRDGAPVQLNPNGPPASGAVQIALASTGALLVAWTSAEGIALSARDASGATQSLSGGKGSLVKLSADPLGGYWALVAHADRWFLRHYAESGTADREDLLPVNEPCASADFALLQRGAALAFAVERPNEAQPVEVHLLRPDGQPIRAEPWTFPQAGGDRPVSGVQNPRIAAQGADLLVAWSDRRSGDLDVWSSLIRAGAVGPEQRLNRDGPSSYQLAGGLSSNGRTAIAVWQDERWGGARVLGRVVTADAKLAAEEIAIDGPLGPGHRKQTAPSVAMDASGAFLVAWWEAGERGAQMKARVYGADARPLAAALELDPSAIGESLFTPSVAALPAGRGFAVAWIRKNGSPAVARVTAQGTLEAPALGLGPVRAAQSRNPFVCTLSDGRLVALWDTRDENANITLHGMFLRADCTSEERELSFPASPGGGDQDPCAVAVPGGGFLMAWTGNEGPERDVFARVYDNRGEPAGLPLPVSVRSNEQDFAALCTLADGSYLVAWEDDISGRDHCVARRIGADLKTMGPTITLNQRATGFVEDRTHPFVCALGDGFAGIFDDRRRSLGMDVFLRVVGGGFDALKRADGKR